jgi:hypothetical protein
MLWLHCDNGCVNFGAVWPSICSCGQQEDGHMAVDIDILSIDVPAPVLHLELS